MTLVQVTKQQQRNGKIVYYLNGKGIRLSKHDYKYALLYKAKKSMGAVRDSEQWRVVGLGNNPASLRSLWQQIYHYGILMVTEIL